MECIVALNEQILYIFIYIKLTLDLLIVNTRVNIVHKLAKNGVLYYRRLILFCIKI